MSNLLIGLPDDLTIQEVLPRLPWYTRPVCRAASKLWRMTIDSKAEDSSLQRLTRRYQLPFLTGSTVVSLADNSNDQNGHLLLIKDLQGHVRKLPPVTFFPGKPRLVCWNGMVYAWTLAGWKCWGGQRDQIFKLDIGGGKWRWQRFPVRYISAWFDGVCFNGNIYAAWKLRHSHRLGTAVRLDVQVYDTETDTCRKIEKWPYMSVGTSWDSVQGSEKLAGFHAETAESWSLLNYVEGMWKQLDVVTGDGWPTDAQFVQGDCFVPAFQNGFNIVLIRRNYNSDQREYVIKWYNTGCSQKWTEIQNLQGGLAGSFTLKDISVVDGHICALCRDGNGDEKELKHWCILNGTIDSVSNTIIWEDLAKSTITWEEVREFGGSEPQCWTVMKASK